MLRRRSVATILPSSPPSLKKTDRPLPSVAFRMARHPTTAGNHQSESQRQPVVAGEVAGPGCGMACIGGVVVLGSNIGPDIVGGAPQGSHGSQGAQGSQGIAAGFRAARRCCHQCRQFWQPSIGSTNPATTRIIINLFIEPSPRGCVAIIRSRLAPYRSFAS